MPLRSFRPLALLAGASALTALVSLSGCQTWLDNRYQDSLPPSSGVQPLKGLADTVSVRVFVVAPGKPLSPFSTMLPVHGMFGFQPPASGVQLPATEQGPPERMLWPAESDTR